MATVADLVANVKALAAGLGFDSVPDWADREQPIASTRALVRIASTSEVALGSNSTVRLVEVELTLALRMAAPTSTATWLAAMHATMVSSTDVDAWANLAAVRASPLPEVETERELEKVGQVLVFAVRAQVALEA